MKLAVRAALIDAEFKPDLAEEIAFHMSDWTENLEEISQIYNQGEDMEHNSINQIIITFLAHVPNHLAAAKKLIGLGPIDDIFDVGVNEHDE